MKPLLLRGRNIRIPIIFLINGRGFINQGSTLSPECLRPSILNPKPQTAFLGLEPLGSHLDLKLPTSRLLTLPPLHPFTCHSISVSVRTLNSGQFSFLGLCAGFPRIGGAFLRGPNEDCSKLGVYPPPAILENYHIAMELP